MTQPIWIEIEAVLAMHSMTINEHGGSTGIRDPGLLDLALARPKQLYAYSHPSLFELAASYAFGLAKNHAFVDGNKRIAFLVSHVFLVRNGLTLIASSKDKYNMYYGLAAGLVSEKELAHWLESNCQSR